MMNQTTVNNLKFNLMRYTLINFRNDFNEMRKTINEINPECLYPHSYRNLHLVAIVAEEFDFPIW